MKRNGPGKSYREGITLVQMIKMFPDNDAALRWFEEARWGESRIPDCCPSCGKSDKISVVPSGKPLPYWCGHCRSAFSVKTGTVMHRSKISYQNWAIAIFLWTVSLKGVSSMQLYRHLGITQKSAHFMAHRLREAWTEDTEADREGPVEVDETHIGGLIKNMSNQKRKEHRGRGTAGKTVVIGVKDRDSGNIRAEVIPSTSKEDLQGFIADNVAPGATVYTDEHASYKDRPYYDHEYVTHSAKQFVDGMAHTNGMESFWALLKRGYHGTFHKMSEKHLHRYINEFATRQNLREEDTLEIMKKTVGMMVGKRLTYKQMTEGKD